MQLMNKQLNIRIASIANKISKESTLIEIIELLESCNISIKGNTTNTSKKNLFLNSVKLADDITKEKLLKKLSDIPISKNNSNVDLINLHPTFKGSKVEKFLKSGDSEEAVRVAFIRINNRVKLMSGLSSADGASLMRGAFSKNAPKIKLNSLNTQGELDEQEGLMHIFEGSMLAFRNPHSHDDERRITSREAQRILSLANYLMEVLDKTIKQNKLPAKSSQ